MLNTVDPLSSVSIRVVSYNSLVNTLCGCVSVFMIYQYQSTTMCVLLSWYCTQSLTQIYISVHAGGMQAETSHWYQEWMQSSRGR